MTEEDSIQGAWFSTSDMKLAVSLHAAGFPFQPNAECTRMTDNQGKESFTWHFRATNSEGDDISSFLRAWENPIGEGIARPSAMTCFLVAREAMFTRTHVLTESHKVPNASLRNRGDQKLIISPRLGRKEREALQRIAS